MKFIATILGIITLVMPVQTTLAGLNCMVVNMETEKAFTCCCKKMDGCSSHKSMHKKKERGKDCDKKNCPYEACCCCYVIIERHGIKAPYTILQTEKIRLLNDAVLPVFIADCWHPPELKSGS